MQISAVHGLLSNGASNRMMAMIPPHALLTHTLQYPAIVVDSTDHWRHSSCRRHHSRRSPNGSLPVRAICQLVSTDATTHCPLLNACRLASFADEATPPQLLGSVVRLISHPSEGSPLQLPKPEVQVIVHVCTHATGRPIVGTANVAASAAVFRISRDIHFASV